MCIIPAAFTNIAITLHWLAKQCSLKVFNLCQEMNYVSSSFILRTSHIVSQPISLCGLRVRDLIRKYSSELMHTAYSPSECSVNVWCKLKRIKVQFIDCFRLFLKRIILIILCYTCCHLKLLVWCWKECIYSIMILFMHVFELLLIHFILHHKCVVFFLW